MERTHLSNLIDEALTRNRKRDCRGSEAKALEGCAGVAAGVAAGAAGVVVAADSMAGVGAAPGARLDPASGSVVYLVITATTFSSGVSAFTK